MDRIKLKRTDLYKNKLYAELYNIRKKSELYIRNTQIVYDELWYNMFDGRYMGNDDYETILIKLVRYNERITIKDKK